MGFMRKIFLITVVMILVCSLGLTAQTKKTIVVPAFEGSSRKDGEILSDLVSSKFADRNLFEVVTRTSIEAIMTEQDFQRSGLTDITKAKELGRLVNADYIIVGRIAIMENTIIVTLQMIDVVKGNIILGKDTSFSNFSEIVNSMDAMVREMVESISPSVESIIAMYESNTVVDEIKSLVNRGVHAKNNKGNTALMLASKHGYMDIVKALISSNSNIHAKNNDGETALIEASSEGHVDIVETLIAAGSNVNAKDNIGWTASMWASAFGYTEIVNILKTAGAKSHPHWPLS